MRAAVRTGREVASAIRLYNRVTVASTPYLPSNRRERDDLYLIHDALNHLDKVRGTPLSGFAESDFDRMRRELKVNIATAKLLHSRIYLSPLIETIRSGDRRSARGKLVVSVGRSWRHISPGRPAAMPALRAPVRRSLTASLQELGYRLPETADVQDVVDELGLLEKTLDRLLLAAGPPPRRAGEVLIFSPVKATGEGR